MPPYVHTGGDDVISAWMKADCHEISMDKTMENFFEEPEVDGEIWAAGTCSSLQRTSSGSSSASEGQDTSNMLRRMRPDLFDGSSRRCCSVVEVRARSPSPCSRSGRGTPLGSRSGSVSPVTSTRRSALGQDMTKNIAGKVMRSCIIGASAMIALASATSFGSKLTKSIEVDYSNTYVCNALFAGNSALRAPAKAMSFDAVMGTIPGASEKERWAFSSDFGGGGTLFEHGDDTMLRLRGGKQSRSQSEHTTHMSESSGQECQECAKASASVGGHPKRQDSDDMIILEGKRGSAGFRPKLSRTVDLH